MPIGRKNLYTCDQCKGTCVTIDRDEGTTLPKVACVVKKNCKGTMDSSAYVCDASRAPTHEWYRPLRSEYAGLDEGTKIHVGSGGLLLREIHQ